jgi:transcriptional regulator with XRE-family HTH domain
MRRARAKRKWSLSEAARQLGVSSHHAVRTLEGSNPDRAPGGLDCKLGTVLQIIAVYWPDVDVDDFAGRRMPFEIVPRDSYVLNIPKERDTG